MRKKVRDNKGSISTVVTVTVLFFTVILSTAYMVASTNRKTQIKSELVAKETYEKTLSNLDEVREEITGLPKTDETQPYFPSSNFKRVAGTNLENGLVIEDSEGNQYVWVEVPKNTTVYPTAGLNIANFTDDEYTKIENDLHTYTSVYRNNTTYSDTWAEDTANEGWLTESEYYTLKKKMLKSVYQNGGFYVGRYEAGIDSKKEQARNYGEDYTTLHETMQKPVIKANAYPYTWVRRTQAQQLAKSFFIEKSYTSSLMFGVQWDLVLAFMSKDSSKISSDLTELISNSTSIGNYRDSVFKLNPTSQYAIMSNWTLSTIWNSATIPTSNFVDSNSNKMSQSSDGNCILVTTGTSEQNKVMNIYDIAGNAWEWTLEKTSNNSAPCTYRGGSCYYSGFIFPVAYRNDGPSVIYSFGDVGFRVSIY